ncbi:Organic cation/carnitine transporter 1 [Sesamum angolense]|uniref:Organic cation/carnitine transporter 1 n=1 Tax=Sesamum angolense TaxID=2727404 RepID=A0AAE1WKP1_9LAMI|nr:Organic cation/carnitine transporter 1 [Sesamum angolense]
MDEERRGLVKKQSPVGNKLQLTVDEVVEEYVGSFGFSQLLQVFLVSLAWIFDAHSTLVTIFTDAQPESWRCIAPDCGGTSGQSGGGGGDASVCRLKPGTWEWSDGNASSIIAEWGLVCDRRFLAALPASVYFLGSLIGSAVFGCLADAFLGRKRSVLLSCLLTSATIFLTSLSPNIWIYALLRFANGFFRAGIGICCLVLSTEAVGRKWRGQVGQYGFFFFAAGFLSIPLIAYPTRTCWRNLYKIISFIPLVYSVFILVPFVSESPRWLLHRGRSGEALEVLKRYARINGKELPLNLSLLEPSGNEKNLAACEGENNTSTIEKLWNTRWAAKRMSMVMLTGFGIGFVYYGVQLNVENLNFNLYFTVAINAMMEIPAVFIGSVLLSFMNRRLLFSSSAVLAGISCISCIIFSSTEDSNVDKLSMTERGSLPQLMIEAIGFMAVSTAFDVLYIYCVELFPTNVRNFAVSMLRQTLMLGASVSSLLVVFGRLNPSVSFLVFGVLSIVSGLFSLWLPETRNFHLYETLEQQEEDERLNCGCRESGELGRDLDKKVELKMYDQKL